jgi:starvation-inducible DNA-binding protein
MYKTRNDLSVAARGEIAELLNARLADAIDLYLQTKQAHWNVRGPNFIALHELFDKLADEVSDYVDDMAERITALGGIAEGTIAAVGKRTQLKSYPIGAAHSKEHIDALANAYAAFGKSARQAIDQAGKAGDADTSDLFTGISRGVDKSLWLLEAHEA